MAVETDRHFCLLFPEGIIESKGSVFLELPVSMMSVACGMVIESRIDEDVTGDVLVELKANGVLPLQLGSMIGRESVQSGFP